MGAAAVFYMSFSEFDRGIPSTRLQKQKLESAAIQRRNDMFARWRESQRILDILRSIKPSQDDLTPENIAHWYGSIENFDWLGSPAVESPSLWFNIRFPVEAERYGNAFLEEKTEFGQCRPLFCNVDLMGAILGGEQSLGHQVVYCPDEGVFYYKDPVLDAFAPTTAAKIQLLASNYMVKCAESFGNKVTILPLLDNFRRVDVLKGIINKAKVILQAENSFFSGPQGMTRCIDGHRITPTTEPAHQQFVKRVMERLPGARITTSEAHARYVAYCNREHLPTMAPAV